MKIIVYTKTACGWAEEVKDFLNERNIPFEERDMLVQPEYKEEIFQRTGQWKSPTLDIDGVILADSDVEQVEQFLKEKGVA